MQSPIGHLTYCTNIHAGESWEDHFSALQQAIPVVKQSLAPDQPFGIGLRLSNEASLSLQQEKTLGSFQQWLQENGCYVFTLNGFPYGGFHRTVVKDQVHAPDWTTQERVEYTIRLAHILATLLPGELDGGISTSPLTYRRWFKTFGEKHAAFEQATTNILQVVKALVRLKETTGKIVHLDIEPEPDGLVESGSEFLQWYNEYLLPMGASILDDQLGYCKDDAVKAIKEHVQLCYDVCHFAVGYESHSGVWQQLRMQQIKVGKIQISAALKGVLSEDRAERASVYEAFGQFNETTYLHQVIAKRKDGSLERYNDLPQALQEEDDLAVSEWRAHFHVPLFIESYGALLSTQSDIREVLQLQAKQPSTAHLEVETYTWEVLPEELKRPLSESIIRELQWVLDEINGLKRVDA